MKKDEKQSGIFIFFSVLIVASLLTLSSVFFLLQRQRPQVNIYSPPGNYTQTQEEKEVIFEGNISNIGPAEFEGFKKEKGFFLTERVLSSDKVSLECKNIYVFYYRKNIEGSLPQNVLTVIAEVSSENISSAKDYLNSLSLSEEKLTQELIKPLPFVTLEQKGGFEVQDIARKTIGKKSVLLNYKGKESDVSNYILGFLKKNVLVILFSGGPEANVEFLEKLATTIEGEI